MARDSTPKIAKIRAPTHWVWSSCVLFAVATGELYRALDTVTPRVLGFFLDPAAVAPAFGLAGTALLLSTAWLLSLYLLPGTLELHGDDQRLVRKSRLPLGWRRIEAPLQDWSIRLIFYSSLDRERGSFKRLELSTRDFSEALLLTDFASPADQWLQELESFRQHFQGYEIVLEHNAS